NEQPKENRSRGRVPIGRKANSVRRRAPLAFRKGSKQRDILPSTQTHRKEPTMAATATAPATQQSVTATYNTLEQAESTVRALDKAGFPVKQVTVLARDIQDESKVHGYVTACDVSCVGAQRGAWVGGIFGLLIGAAFVWVPGLGPLVIGGSLVSALAGGV